MDFLPLFLIGFGLCTLLCLLILRFFPAWGLLDRPDLYGLKRAPIPYPGGVAIVLSFSLLLPLLFTMTPAMWAFLGGGLLLSVVNFLDDRHRLPPWLRLSTHILVGAIVVAGGVGVSHISNPFGGHIPLDTLLLPITLLDGSTLALWSALFTIGWVVLIINTINWLDSIPGLTSGIGAIGAATLFGLSVLLIYSQSTTMLEKEHAEGVARMALLFAGICLAFLRYDFFPARAIIGDTGTMYIGYTLAVLAIISGGKIATTFLVLGFPILDAFWVILRRVLHGQSPFKGDLRHFPHRLLSIGCTERQAIGIIYLICALFGTIALLLLQNGPHSKLMAILTMTILMVLVGTCLILIERSRARRQSRR